MLVAAVVARGPVELLITNPADQIRYVVRNFVYGDGRARIRVRNLNTGKHLIVRSSDGKRWSERTGSWL